MKRKEVRNWMPLRKMIDEAYAELGLSMTEVSPGVSEYPVEHWNLAAIIYEKANAPKGKCCSCETPLTYNTVIRCLECKSELCENCAPSHFGPNHGRRAALAHPTNEG